MTRDRYEGEAAPPLPGSTTFKLTLAYDGTAFRGWQRLSGKARTVQGVLEDALSEIAGARVFATGASRTDAGVHAEGQVASASLPWRGDPAGLAAALCARLPDDLACLRSEAADPRFHARYLARGKVYRYRVLDSPVGDPFAARYALRVPRPLDVARMDAAARAFEGTKDFRAFANLKGKEANPARTIRTARATRVGPFVELLFEGDGFLRNQARAMAGALVEVGAGRLDGGGIEAILASGARSPMAPAADPRGLCLVRVIYGPAEGA